MRISDGQGTPAFNEIPAVAEMLEKVCYVDLPVLIHSSHGCCLLQTSLCCPHASCYASASTLQCTSVLLEKMCVPALLGCEALAPCTDCLPRRVRPSRMQTPVTLCSDVSVS